MKTIYCSQFERTQQTAEPLARKLNAAVITIEADLKQPEKFIADIARKIKSQHTGETVLVISHSNTTPRIAEALGARNVPPINDDEYDKLLIVVTNADAYARVVKARY